MKLLIDAHVFDGAFQGTRTYIEGLYTHLTQHGDLDFFFAAQQLDIVRRVFGVADNIHYLQLHSGSSIKRLAFEYPRLIKKNGIEFAHFQYVSPLYKCCKEIVTCHDLLFLDMPQYFPWGYRKSKNILFKRSAKRADILLTVSEFSKDEIKRHFGIPANKVYVTPNGILLPSSSMTIPDIKEKYGVDKFVLTVSRLEPRKNHAMLMSAFFELELDKQGYYLVMIGAKDIRNKELWHCLELLSDAQREKVRMLKVDYPELIAFYRQASLFVFPSLGEGFGIPPLEALSQNCPVLCSKVTAMAEFGLPESMLFNPSDKSELKSKMIDLLNNPVDMTQLGRMVLMKYDWGSIAEDFYQLLKSKGTSLVLSGFSDGLGGGRLLIAA